MHGGCGEVTMGARRFIAVLVLFLGSVSGVLADSRHMQYHVTADWQLGVRFGVEAPLSPRLSARGDLGLSMLGLILGDALVGVSLFDPSAPVNVQILIGVPNAAAAMTLAGAMASVGGTLRPSVEVGTRCRLGIRIGAGFPFFFERDRPVVRETNLPLGLWPDAGIDITWRPSNRLPR